MYTYPIYIKLACMIRMITLILPLCCLFNPERHELARGIYIIREVYIQGWTQRGRLRGGGGGGTLSRRLEPSGARRERGEEALAHWRGVRGCSPGKFFKIYVSENAFQAILKPFFAIFNNLSLHTNLF